MNVLITRIKYNQDEEITDEFDVKLGNQKDHKKYREIVDSKDTIYNEQKKMKKRKNKHKRRKRIKKEIEKEEEKWV